MNKNEYLNALSNSLSGISESEKEEILYDYNEYFENGLLEGRTEEEISKSLGNPKDISKQIKFEKKSKNTILRKIIASSALLMFNVMFVLGPILWVFMCLVIVFTGSIAITSAGVIMVLEPVFQLVIPHYFIFEPFLKALIPQFEVIPAAGLFYAGVGVLTAIIGVFAMFLTAYFTKLFHKGIVWYLRINLDIING
ncbi:putative membrane protein [Methanococcus maripaludis]|uniref:Putative membrane protein n=1 Tax=Methanococcus maripaludis TaxID=39152 RepID=A0A7J9P3F8_METMI|nr:DUF1700 domain-containing protein [Methanococcus maripaludis]MBA2853964.1 putative membrane protein [Methanococcus maripaludis]